MHRMFVIAYMYESSFPAVFLVSYLALICHVCCESGWCGSGFNLLRVVCRSCHVVKFAPIVFGFYPYVNVGARCGWVLEAQSCQKHYAIPSV